MFPATGSTMTAATCFGQRSIANSTSRSALNRATSVSSVVAGVIPGVPGMPSVATPEPASTSSASACP